MKPQTPSSQTAAVKPGCVEGPPPVLSKYISLGARWLLGLSPGLGQSEWRGWEATHRTAATQGRGTRRQVQGKNQKFDMSLGARIASVDPEPMTLTGSVPWPSTAPGGPSSLELQGRHLAVGCPLVPPESLVSFSGRKNLPGPGGVRGTGAQPRCRAHRNSLCYLYEFSVDELF